MILIIIGVETGLLHERKENVKMVQMHGETGPLVGMIEIAMKAVVHGEVQVVTAVILGMKVVEVEVVGEIEVHLEMTVIEMKEGVEVGVTEVLLLIPVIEKRDVEDGEAGVLEMIVTREMKVDPPGEIEDHHVMIVKEEALRIEMLGVIGKIFRFSLSHVL